MSISALPEQVSLGSVTKVVVGVINNLPFAEMSTDAVDVSVTTLTI